MKHIKTYDDLFKSVYSEDFIKKELENIEKLHPVYAESIYTFACLHYPNLIQEELELNDFWKKELIKWFEKYLKKLTKPNLIK